MGRRGHNNNTPAASSQASCPGAPFPQAQNNNTNCNFSSLKLSQTSEVTHSVRRFIQLRHAGSYSQPVNGQRLEVLAGKTDESGVEVTIEDYNLIQNCHNNPIHRNTIYVMEEVLPTPVVSGNNQIKFKAKAKESNGVLEWLWPRNARIVRRFYAVRAVTCGNNISAHVVTYPDTYCKIEVGFNFGSRNIGHGEGGTRQTHSGPESSRARSERLHEEANEGRARAFTVEFEVEENGGNKISAGGEISRKIETVEEQVERAYNLLTQAEDVKEEIEQFGAVPFTFDLTMPNGTVSAEWGWKEKVNSSLCVWTQKFTAGLNPLIGFSCSVDLTMGIRGKIEACTELMRYLHIENIVSLDIEATLALNADININFTHGVNNTGNRINTGRIEGGIDLSIEAHISVGILFLSFGVRAHTNAKLVGGASVEFEDHCALIFYLYNEEIKLTFAMHYGADGSVSSHEPFSPSRSGEGNMQHSFNREYPMVEEKQWCDKRSDPIHLSH